MSRDYPVNAWGKVKPVEWPIGESDIWLNKKAERGTLFVYVDSWPKEEGTFAYTTIEDYVDDDGDTGQRVETETCSRSKVHLNERDGVITFKEVGSGDKYAFDIRDCVRV